jgi:predicted AlkP superfamily phosphohydrolase/phosphomutase
MAPSRPLLTIGLDAVETPLLQRLMEDGRAPNLARLAQRAVATPIDAECMSLLPGAIWQDLLLGRNAGEHGDYYLERVHTGDRVARRITPGEHQGQYYFDHAAEAGLRVTAVDLPLVPHYRGHDNLTLVAEWHVHDAVWTRGTHPEALLAELEARFGRRPYDRCDTNHGADDESLFAFAEMLQAELAIKTDMALHLLHTRPWDHFVIGLSQGHCAGHQLWDVHDRLEHSGDPTTSDPLIDVYVAIDRSIGRLIDAAGPQADVVVLTSHGMNRYVGGPQLLPSLLEAWGYGNPRPQLSLVRRAVPRRLVNGVFRAAPWLLASLRNRGTLSVRLGPDVTAVAVPNNRVGAIRLNVAGREPDGTVTDVDAALGELEERLRRVRHATTGEPVVERTERTAEVYGPAHHGDLPDLLVVFRRDLGALTTVDCDEAGRVFAPIQLPYYPRTGDHTDESHIWIDHHRVAGVQPMRSTDVAATLLSLLGVEPRPGIEGRCRVVPADPSGGGEA